jgi:nucleoside diphosphate kinase
MSEELLLEDADYKAGKTILRKVAGRTSDLVAANTGLVMFTPACLIAGRLEEGLRYLKSRHFIVPFARRVVLTDAQVRRVWRFQAKQFSPERWDVAVRLFCAGPAVVSFVTAPPEEGSFLVARLKDLQGPSDPDVLNDGHLRKRLEAPSKLNNLVHVADSTAAVLREAAVMLPPGGLASAWRAMVSGGPTLDIELFSEVARPVVGDEAACVVRIIARIFWRAFDLARQLIGTSGSPCLTDAMGEQLEWSKQLTVAGAEALRLWRKRYAAGNAAVSALLGWLAADSSDDARALYRAIDGLQMVLLDQAVDLRALESDLHMSGLAPDQWELLTIATEIMSQEIRRGG